MSFQKSDRFFLSLSTGNDNTRDALTILISQGKIFDEIVYGCFKTHNQHLINVALSQVLVYCLLTQGPEME